MPDQEEDTIKKANEVGSLINNWVKIGSLVVGAVVSCTYAYYLIISNSSDITDIKKDMELMKEEYKKQYGIFREASEKKEGQYKEAAVKYMDWMLKHEERLNELEKENAYQKGLIEELQKHRK